MYELTTRTKIAKSLNLHEVKISLTEANQLLESIQRKYLAAKKLSDLAKNLGYSTTSGDFSEILQLLNDNEAIT